MIDTFLSLFGLGQSHMQTVGHKFTEAHQLNAEFELYLSNSSDLIRSESVHLRHRINALCEDPLDAKLLLDQLEPLLQQLLSENNLALKTADNTYISLKNSSRFATLKQWNECIAMLHRQVSASKYQAERV